MTRTPIRLTCALLAGLAILLAGDPQSARSAVSAPGADSIVVDDFESIGAWSANPADGVMLDIASDSGALRMDFDFASGGGYAVIHRDIDLNLPDNYAFTFQVRGEALPNTLEFKLVDDSGENLWWSTRKNFEFPPEWSPFQIKKRHIVFAWGPQGGGTIHHIAAIEFAVTAGEGGSGRVWLDDLELRALPPDGAPLPPPDVRASSSSAGHPAANALVGSAQSTWVAAPDDDHPYLELDLHGLLEFGGLRIRWGTAQPGLDYDVRLSLDGAQWRTVREVRGSNGGVDILYLPESECHFLQVVIHRPPTVGAPAIEYIETLPLQYSSSRNAFFENIAAEAPRGDYPRGFSGEQNFWTVVGVDADPRESLFGEDGAIEATDRHIRVEPLLRVGDELLDWSRVQSRQSLEEGFLPMPSVTLVQGPLTLQITAFAEGAPGASSIVVRYRLTNSGTVRQTPTLYLALRPFQVNPPSQFLNQPSGVVEIREIVRRGATVEIDGQAALVCLREPDAFGATTYDGGDIVADHLRQGSLPAAQEVVDPFGAASAALVYRLGLEPKATAEVDVLLPLYDGADELPRAAFDDAPLWVERQFDQARDSWLDRSERVAIDLPPSARRVSDSLKAQLGYILVNRAGVAIQPGTRSYARSWIRDGALTGSALLRLGHDEAARSFLEWFASHQYDSGKIPCVVDHRGADPVPEHDSSGEFIFLTAEIDRYTHDLEFTRVMWPHVRTAVSYLDSLRHLERGDGSRPAENPEFFGLLPPSISHEGYSAKPMHSYWDDFFAWRGFSDAAYLADRLGLDSERDRIAAIEKEFRGDLLHSINSSMLRHDIDFIPGCADLGDFDPTATTVVLAPLGATSTVPAVALRATFERYWEFFRARLETGDWEVLTPYEIRNIDAFVHLGWRDRAQQLLDFFLDCQRPAGWRQWPEVVTSNQRVPRFLGDLPHTWVGSDYVRAVLDMMVFVRDQPASLVVGAGVPLSWLQDGGWRIQHLRSPFGPIDVEMQLVGESIHIDIGGAVHVPKGGIVVLAPSPWPIARATVNGSELTLGPDGQIQVHQVPARIRLEP